MGVFFMSKVLLVFATMSGNTEEIADLIQEGIESEGLEVVKKEIDEVAADQMENFDSIILGAYTWGDGELPDEFEEFYDEMDDVNLEGKNFAVFGSGDTMYPIFCGAVDVLEEKIKEKNGNLLLEGLKIELSPEDDEDGVERSKSFGVNFAKALNDVAVK